MTRQAIFLALLLGYGGAALAQEANMDQVVIYKWVDKGVTHYSKVPPRNMSGVVMIDKYGLRINDESSLRASYEAAMQPIRPQASGVNPAIKAGAPANNAPLPEGTITREQRCEQAQHDIAAIKSNTVVYETDAQGNLVPVSDEGKAERLANAQQLAAELCE